MFFLQGEPLGKLVSLASQPEHESFVLDARHDSIVVSLCELSYCFVAMKNVIFKFDFLVNSLVTVFAYFIIASL